MHFLALLGNVGKRLYGMTIIYVIFVTKFDMDANALSSVIWR